MALNTFAADAPDRPLHVLYLGPVSKRAAVAVLAADGAGARTNYVYLPGQTLAPEAIYFDHRSDVTQSHGQVFEALRCGGAGDA